ncbi:hypothetical protein B5K11_02760 [Rhizobium leguminosarum bv. trifolii]|nr:hypothetical protein B5K11_02760 [Rhizobium leguminosarum bv. trifolii]
MSPSALPGISPTGGEIGWAKRFPQTTSVAAGRNGRRSEKAKPLVISPPVGEMAGRPEGAFTARP